MLGKLIAVTQKLQEKQVREIYLAKSMELEKAKPNKETNDFSGQPGSTPIVQGGQVTAAPAPKAPKKPAEPKPAVEPKVKPMPAPGKDHHIVTHLGQEFNDQLMSDVHDLITSGKHEEAKQRLANAHHAATSKSYVNQINEAMGKGDIKRAHALVDEHADFARNTIGSGESPAKWTATPKQVSPSPKANFVEQASPMQFTQMSHVVEKPKASLANFANFISSRNAPTPAQTIDNAPISSLPEDKNPETAPGVTDPTATTPPPPAVEQAPAEVAPAVANIENIDPAALKPTETPVVVPTKTGRKIKVGKGKKQNVVTTPQPQQDANRQQEADLTDLAQQVEAMGTNPNFERQDKSPLNLEQKAQKEEELARQKQMAQASPVDEAERDTKLAALKDKIKRGKYKVEPERVAGVMADTLEGQ